MITRLVTFLITLYVPCFVSAAHIPQSDSTATPADTFHFRNSDSLMVDSTGLGKSTSYTISLIDSLQNDTLLGVMFHPYYSIRSSYKPLRSQRTQIPGIKEIQVRPATRHPWRFWIICFILIYIGFIRIVNPNNFRVFLLSVFNLKLSQRIWEEQRTTFSFVTLQLFAIYLFIASVFILNWLEMHHLNPTGNYYYAFGLITLILCGVYFAKFAIHALLGGLLKIKKMGIGFVSNTVSVNNFIALVVFPFVIFLTYNTDKVWHTILTQTVISIFFVSVLYRLFRIVVLSNTFFTLPRIYLFLYLCALEILPWFILIKFINTYPI